MKITKKDIEKLKDSINYIFYFQYVGEKNYDKSLHSSILNFLSSKEFKTISVRYINSDLYQSSIFPKNEALRKLEANEIEEIELDYFSKKEYQNEFLDQFLGKDIKELEGFFQNYSILTGTKYFQDKAIFAPDTPTLELKKLLLSGRQTNGYYTLKADVNYLYRYFNKIFEGYSVERLYEKYKKNNVLFQEKRKQSIEARVEALNNALQGIIIFKRPIEELNELLEKNIELLPHPVFGNYVKKFDSKIMPDIIEKISSYIQKSKGRYLNEVAIKEEEESYKLVNIELNDLVLKHSEEMISIYDKLDKKLSVIRKKMPVLCETIDNETSFSVLFKGNKYFIELAIRILFQVINNKKLFDSSLKSFEQLCEIKMEKDSIGHVLIPVANQKIKNKI